MGHNVNKKYEYVIKNKLWKKKISQNVYGRKYNKFQNYLNRKNVKEML